MGHVLLFVGQMLTSGCWEGSPGLAALLEEGRTGLSTMMRISRTRGGKRAVRAWEPRSRSAYTVNVGVVNTP